MSEQHASSSEVQLAREERLKERRRRAWLASYPVDFGPVEAEVMAEVEGW